MTVIFVAPDESDEEELTNCESSDHLKYKFITNDNSTRTSTLSEGIDFINRKSISLFFIIVSETLRP